MEGTCAAGDRCGRLSGETPRTSDSAGYAGTWRRQAPGRRQNVFRMQRKPHGSCGSLEDPPVPGLAEDPGVPARRVMARPDAEGRSTRGDQRRRKPLRRPGDHELRRGLEGSGTTAVEPGRAGSSALEAAELSISYSSEFETVEHRGREGARGAATRLGLSARKGPMRENPRSGSGPSVSARLEGEQPVEGVRNPKDGWCRAVDGPGDTDPSAEVAEWVENLDEGQSGPAGPVRALEPEPWEGGEACGSRRAVSRPNGWPNGGKPRGRKNDVEGVANQCRRYAGRSAPRGS